MIEGYYNHKFQKGVLAMIRCVKINDEPHMISKDPKDFFTDDSVKQQKCRVALVMMEDCLDIFII